MFDEDNRDFDFRSDLSDEQLERLEGRQALARRPAQPPTTLAAAAERLAPGAGGAAATQATSHDVGDVPSPALGTASARPSRFVGFGGGQVPSR